MKEFETLIENAKMELDRASYALGDCEQSPMWSTVDALVDCLGDLIKAVETIKDEKNESRS